MFLRFRKSSYSDSHENCVEVAPILNFRKSSYSDSHDNCVEVAQIPSFRKSSYSTSDENCVEVADLPTGAALRDSKRPETGHLDFTAREWGAFLAAFRGQDV
ncbi:hypothetical protein F4561_004008 [Lipingzhangella halophila]|uniref:DUF397 domain-containing protein n=1 Tax=Lipingzhangella halophila TaxID=1783352 RepID=A0A7W7RKE1_9ACTN|nr:DUF397 domain-containing protein [Lipingzhangella halophila]MBB4933188.1 hypothetical protein [Lipingzhangella halophila]